MERFNVNEPIKQFTVMDGNGHSMPVNGYQAANQLAHKYLEHGDVAVIVIIVEAKYTTSFVKG